MRSTRARAAAAVAAALAVLAPAAPAVGATEHAPAATEVAEAASGPVTEAAAEAPGTPRPVASEEPSRPAPQAPAATAPEGAVKAPTLGFLRAQGGLWSTQVPQDAGGELRTVTGSALASHEAERTVPVRVVVESGLGVNGPEFARQVLAALNDPRGWGHDGSVAFERTPDAAEFEVVLASPATTDELCAPLETRGEVSCAIGGRAVLNAERWALGAEPFREAGGTLAEYRQYLVNHEVGHLLGHGHEPCPAPGATAPVMLQQTLWLDGCVPNGWPAATD